MDTKIVLKLSLIGLLVFSFAFYANGDKVAQKAKTENRNVKSSRPSRIAVAIGKFENRSNAPDEISRGIRTRIQQCVTSIKKFDVQEREKLKEAMKERQLVASGISNGTAANVSRVSIIRPVSYIIYGNVLSYSVDRHIGDSNSSASAFVKSTIELQVKIVNVNSARILSIKTFWGHGMEKEIVSGGSKSSAGDGLREAIDEAAHAVRGRHFGHDAGRQVGIVIAAAAGYFALRFMLKIIAKVPLSAFAVYLAILGIIFLALQLSGSSLVPAFAPAPAPVG